MARKAPKTQRERARDRVRELTSQMDLIRRQKALLEKAEKDAWRQLKIELETLAKFEAKITPETAPEEAEECA